MGAFYRFEIVIDNVTNDREYASSRRANGDEGQDRRDERPACRRRGPHFRREEERRRIPFVLLAAVLALLLASCGGNDESADEGAGGTSTSGSTSGGEAVTIDWWHIQNTDPGLPVEDGRRRVHGGPPQRHDQDHVAGERGVQDQARRRDLRRATRPTCSSPGVAAC